MKDRYIFYEFLLGLILMIILLISGYCNADEKIKFAEEIKQLKIQYEKLEKQIVEQNEEIIDVISSIKHTNLGSFIISFYDLSTQSCGKLPSHKEYGVSKSGFNLRGQTWETARAIAVDKNIIPLGSKVFINFDNEEYKFLNGIYTAYDTGSAIKGNKIDLFIGENQIKKCMELGVTEANIILLSKGGE